MSREAMKLALEALRFARDDGYENEVSQEAITAIKQALAAPVQEPVAWVCYGFGGEGKHGIDYEQSEIDAIPVGTLLYTTPPAQEFVCSTGLCHYKAQREWVGMTDDDFENAFQETYIMGDSDLKDFAKVIEAKLKEKNT
jgi:hypothetical protein